MSKKPPALRAAVADLERALAGQPAEAAPHSETTEAPEAPAEVRDDAQPDD